MLYRAAVLVTLVAVSVPLISQDWRGEATLGVEVKGDDRDPIEGARVTVTRLTGAERVIEGLTTDRDGRVGVGGLIPGPWLVVVDAEGYMQYRTAVELRVGRKPKPASSALQAVGPDGAVRSLRVDFFEAKGAPAPRLAASPRTDAPAETAAPADRGVETPRTESAPSPSAATRVETPAAAAEPETTAAAETAPEEPSAPATGEGEPAEPERDPAPAANEESIPEPGPAIEPEPTGDELPPSHEDTTPTDDAPSVPPPPAPSGERDEPVAAEGPIMVTGSIETPRPRRGPEACPDCRPDEWALDAIGTVGPSGPGVDEHDCREAFDDRGLPPPTGASPAGGTSFGTLAAGGCARLTVALPEGARMRGFRLAADGQDCLPKQGCPAGEARWIAGPERRDSAAGTAVSALFYNASQTTPREATLTVYYAPAGGGAQR